MTLEERLPHDTQICQSCRVPRNTTRMLSIQRPEWHWPVPVRLCDLCLDGTLSHLFANLPLEWVERFLAGLGVT